MATKTEQPTGVETAEVLKPGDEHVVTSDLPPEETQQEADDSTTAGKSTDDAPNGPKSDAGETTNDGNHKQRHGNSRWQRQQRRIKKAEQRAQAAEQKNQELERRMAALENTRAADKPEPKRTNYKSDAEFARAHVAWSDAQTQAAEATAARKDDKPAGKSQADSNDPPAPVADEADVTEFMQRGIEQLGDVFQEAMDDDPSDPTPINQTMGEFLFESEVGPQIYVHLVNNPDEAAKIFGAKSRSALKQLEALEAKAEKGELVTSGELDDQDDQDDDEPAAKGKASRTKAPPPPESHRDSGSPAVKPDPEKEDMEEYAARRRKQLAARRGYIPT